MSAPRIERAICQAQRQAIHITRPRLSQPRPLFLDFLAPSWSKPQRRPLSSTIARRATAIANPRKDDEGKEMIINITPRAEQQMRKIAQKDGNPDLALRVRVESGGCHGFQYLMNLINTKDVDPEDDTVFMNDGDGEYKARVVMDEPSLELLKGSSIDYTMELIGSQFKVTGIPGAKSSCGCGTSFDIAQ